MPGPRTRKRTIYIATETGGYGVEPSADGSGYLWVPSQEVGDLADDLTPLETNWFTGRGLPTAEIPGPDGASFVATTPLIGLATAAGDTVDASTIPDDWLDAMLLNALGAVQTTEGEGFGAGSAGADLVLDSDVYDIGDPIVAFEAGLPAAGARAQWGQVTVDGEDGTYTVTPAFAANPTDAAFAYGCKVYREDIDGGADSIAIVYIEDDVQYTLLGGKITSLTINAPINGIVRCAWGMRFDSKTVTTKASLPAAGDGPAITPIRSVLNPAFFAGTNLGHVAEINVELGLQATQIMSINGTPNGRASDELVGLSPAVSVNPLRTTSDINLKRNGTRAPLQVQLGRGLFSGGVLNSVGILAAEAIATSVGPQDADGVQRNLISFGVRDGGATSRFIQVCRA